MIFPTIRSYQVSVTTIDFVTNKNKKNGIAAFYKGCGNSYSYYFKNNAIPKRSVVTGITIY
ncbi:hypothetical protein FK004_10165 [Flavobacterium kingsejongi]|uniref:Uncharacterized protein n=1 Tax=Flavobacterium kingsejongi TaxID=1678728 RepID=A0A2S1LPD7_9FLAO|nr:hypothetical protein FK004_10165 [Flavobacterium kingsejongi]